MGFVVVDLAHDPVVVCSVRRAYRSASALAKALLIGHYASDGRRPASAHSKVGSEDFWP